MLCRSAKFPQPQRFSPLLLLGGESGSEIHQGNRPAVLWSWGEQQLNWRHVYMLFRVKQMSPKGIFIRVCLCLHRMAWEILMKHPEYFLERSHNEHIWCSTVVILIIVMWQFSYCQELHDQYWTMLQPPCTSRGPIWNQPCRQPQSQR